MPDWSLFWEQAWIGICGLTYVVLVIAVVCGFFTAIGFGCVGLFHLAVDWWDDRQADIAAAEQRRKWDEYNALLQGDNNGTEG